MVMSWTCNEEPYSKKKKGTSLSDGADGPNKRKIEVRPLNLAMCRLLVTFIISFDGVDSREN